MALDKFRDPADPVWEQRVNGLEEGGQIGAEAITGAKLAKVALPAVGAKAKGEEVLSAVAPTRKQTIMLVAKETEKKYKMTHELGEAVLFVSCIKVSTKATAESNKVLKWESATKTEVEISSGTAVADKEEFFVTLYA